MAWSSPYTFVAGNVLTASQLNTYVSANLSETAPAKVTTKGDIVAATGANAIARTAAGSNYSTILYLSGNTNGIATAPADGLVKQAEYQKVSTTAVETDLISYTVPANAIGATGSVKTFIRYSYQNNSGSTSTYTLKCYLGGTALNIINARSVTTGVTIVGGYAEMEFTNQNATNAQYCIGSVWDSVASGSSLQSSSLAIDTTATAVVKWTITMSVSNASTNFIQQRAGVYIVKAATIA